LIHVEKVDTDIRSNPQVLDVDSTGSKSSEDTDEDSSSSPRRRRVSPEWNTESSYLHRKLQGNGQTDDVADRLRSRLVSRSGREMETDKEQAEAVRSPRSDHISDARNIMSPGRVNPASSHSYNLRSGLKSASHEPQD